MRAIGPASSLRAYGLVVQIGCTDIWMMDSSLLPGCEPGHLRPKSLGKLWADRTHLCFPFDNTYVRLPERFYARLDPAPVAAPRIVVVNTELTERLGLNPNALASSEGVEVLAGNRVPAGAEPLALAYAVT
jgi:hypothetical protein